MNNRNDIKMVENILSWSDFVVVLTKEENDSLKEIGLQNKMPDNWTFFGLFIIVLSGIYISRRENLVKK